MKSNFKLKKILCCALLSLVLAFSNVLAVLNGCSSESQENQVFAAGDYEYCYGSVDIEPIVLNSAVDLSGKVYYTCYCDEDGTKTFKTIDEVSVVLSNSTYVWWQDKFTYILSSDRKKATIRVMGELYNRTTYRNEYTVKEFSIAL